MPQRLIPFQALDADYYLGDVMRDGGGGAESDEEMSSDDELQQELRMLAGVRNECDLAMLGNRQRRNSEFVDDMEDELDKNITDYASTHMMRPVPPASQPLEVDEEMPALEPSSSETSSKAVSNDTKESAANDEEINPIKKMAEDRKKEMEKELPDFYDADEDDDNERWIQEKRNKNNIDTTPKKTKKESRPKIENGSDAVLSCPGCMILLTRDCQRHELYNDQYRAMFVENCVVDEAEKLKIEKTGKEKRRQRQKMRKSGLEMQEEPEDVFMPVKCRSCGTNVAVVDHDEVYHFFNVLAGYS